MTVFPLQFAKSAILWNPIIYVVMNKAVRQFLIIYTSQLLPVSKSLHHLAALWAGCEGGAGGGQLQGATVQHWYWEETAPQVLCQVVEGKIKNGWKSQQIPGQWRSVISNFTLVAKFEVDISLFTFHLIIWNSKNSGIIGNSFQKFSYLNDASSPKLVYYR